MNKTGPLKVCWSLPGSLMLCLIINYELPTTISQSTMDCPVKIIVKAGYFSQCQDSPDQCPMPIKIMALIRNVSQCRSLPINADQFRSIPLIGIDRHWSELIDIGINARILICIDRHWSALGIDRGSPVNAHWSVYVFPAKPWNAFKWIQIDLFPICCMTDSQNDLLFIALHADTNADPVLLTSLNPHRGNH